MTILDKMHNNWTDLYKHCREQLDKANRIMDNATTDEEFECGLKLYQKYISEWVN